ncbi:MAG: GNAT family N-acetyltransferase [archaeon]
MKLWKRYSPGETLWEDAEVAFSFYDSALYSPYFIVILSDGNEAGLMPLSYSSQYSRYYFFGSSHTENHRFWFPPELAQMVFDVLPRPVKLFDINGDAAKKVISASPGTGSLFRPAEGRYYLDLQKIGWNLDHFFQRLSPKHRKNLKYDLKKLAAKGYATDWSETNIIDYIRRYSVERFGAESDYSDEQFAGEIKRFISTLHRIGALQPLTVKVGEDVAGVEFGAFYKSRYYVINGGYNRTIANLGKLLMIEHIKKAIELKATEIDFLVGSGGWKELWNLDQEKYYEIILD